MRVVSEKQVAYQRELQVVLERPPEVEHWDIANTLASLAKSRELNTMSYRGLRWYFGAEVNWNSVKELADRKADLVEYYEKYPRDFTSSPEGVRYDDYSEYLVEDSFINMGLIVMGRNTNYFNGRTYLKEAVAPGRPPDLDFTVYDRKRDLAAGVSVKNKLDYPTDDEIGILLEICEVLSLRPLLVTRMASGKAASRVVATGGGVTMFKRWLLKPGMPQEMFFQISDAGKARSLFGLPVSIYRYRPNMLPERLRVGVESLG